MSLVLLRNCSPGSAEYDDADVLNHFANLHDKDEAEKVGDKYYGHEFSLYDIDKDGTISKDNFIEEFVPAFIIEKRKKNLDAFREGLTLNGTYS